MKNNTNKFFNACNTYILLWLCVYIQNMFLSNSLVSMLFYIPFLLMTLFNVEQVLLSYHLRGVMRVFSLFFIVLLCYGAALLLFNDALRAERDSFLLALFGSLGPIFSFYLYTQKSLLTEEKMKMWFWPFLILAIVGYYVAQQKGMIIALEKGSRYEEITNNSSYFVVGLLPFVFFFQKKPLIQYIIIALLFYFIIIGMKRGAMLTGAIIFLWYVYMTLKTTSKTKKIGVLILMIIVLYVGYLFILDFYETSDYFQHRVEETFEDRTSSNRGEIYYDLRQHFINNDNIIQVLFGEGAYHTTNVKGIKAHNDWYELLIDCGLVTVVIYAIYWFYFIAEIKRNKYNFLICSMLGASFIYSFSRTFFSMSFDDTPFFICMIIGYCFGNSGIKSDQESKQPIVNY